MTDTVLRKEACPKCQERGTDNHEDNLAVYDDHVHCFSCGHHAFTDSSGAPWESVEREEETSAPSGLLTGRIGSIVKRSLTEETCRRYGYLQGHNRNGEGVQIAPYRDGSGRVVAQKLRFSDKGRGLPWVGDKDNPGLQLFGQHLQAKGRMMVVTEGEIDAMSVSQALDNKWPAVSIRTGSAGAKKDLLKQADWLKQFERVVLCFDMDDPGRKAAEECAKALAPLVPVHVVVLPSGTPEKPVKDASDLLQANRGHELAKAIWEAPRWRPKGILRASEVRPRVTQKLVMGRPWPRSWPTLTEKTYGQRPGEVVFWGAGAGVGKTEYMMTLQAEDITTHSLPPVVFSSEQMPEEVMRGIAGKVAGRRFNVPDGGWTSEELESALDVVERSNAIIYDRREDFSWPTLREHIRYLADAEGYRSFYVDNLTACVAHADDQRLELDALMEEMCGLAVTHGLYFNCVSHLTTPKGVPHEEGGRISGVHLTGSRAIIRWASFVFGIERDTQAEGEDVKNCSTIRGIKDRFTGKSDGALIPMRFNPVTGEITEDTGFTPHNEDF